MRSQTLIGHFARLARDNARKARQWVKDGNQMQAEWFSGRSCAYLTAARIARGNVRSDAWMRACARRLERKVA